MAEESKEAGGLQWHLIHEDQHCATFAMALPGAGTLFRIVDKEMVWERHPHVRDDCSSIGESAVREFVWRRRVRPASMALFFLQGEIGLPEQGRGGGILIPGPGFNIPQGGVQ